MSEYDSYEVRVWGHTPPDMTPNKSPPGTHTGTRKEWEFYIVGCTGRIGDRIYKQERVIHSSGAIYLRKTEAVRAGVYHCVNEYNATAANILTPKRFTARRFIRELEARHPNTIANS